MYCGKGNSLDYTQVAPGLHQFCLGQIAGTEAAVHAVRLVFNYWWMPQLLNSLNRSVALHNIQQFCPLLACVLINTYHSPASLFVSGDTILLEEGTTQGDLLTMPMYAIAKILLIHHLTGSVTQIGMLVMLLLVEPPSVMGPAL